MRRFLLFSGAMIFWISSACAQMPPPPLPDGHIILNVSATEQTDVQQNILIASLRADKRGSDPKSVQSDINALMAQALAKAKASPSIQVSTGQYYVYSIDPQAEAGKPAKGPRQWQGVQSLQMKGEDSATILKLAGDLQDMGLIMDGLSYTLSPEKADAAREDLMEKALAKVQAKAQRAAKSLGKPKAELVEVNVDSSNQGVPPRPMMMSMAKSAAADTPPVAEPGTEQIDLTVTARAVLKP